MKPKRKRTAEELSRIRAKAGRKGGKAEHLKRGLELVDPFTRQLVASAGAKARWRGQE